MEYSFKRFKYVCTDFTIKHSDVIKSESKMAKILAVDDEPDLIWVLKRLLERRGGHDIISAENGKSALEKTKKEKPDLVLLDIMMPDIDGWEVCRELKNNTETKDIPVIMLSVVTEKEGIKKSFEYANADWHVGKPFDIDVLLKIIEIASKREKDITEEIQRAMERNAKMKAVLEMINPKLTEYKYNFLTK